MMGGEHGDNSLGGSMHLFGDSCGAYLAHFKARREPDHVDLDWEVRNAVGLRWRVLRSAREFAETAEPLPDGQTLIAEGEVSGVRDPDVVEGRPYFYTVFVQDPEGVWCRQVTVKLARGEHLRWLHPTHKDWGSADELGDGYEPAGAVEKDKHTQLAMLNFSEKRRGRPPNPPTQWEA
jgi:hypothetical protein